MSEPESLLWGELLKRIWAAQDDAQAVYRRADEVCARAMTDISVGREMARDQYTALYRRLMTLEAEVRKCSNGKLPERPTAPMQQTTTTRQPTGNPQQATGARP